MEINVDNDELFNGKPNISLIGFMCCGKTTIGRDIAKAKNINFIDTDEIITSRTKKSIADIFYEQGEQYFRKLESDAVKSLKDVKGAVISCGGGAVLSESNMRILRRISTVIYLSASPEKIYANYLKGNEKRPLLMSEDVCGKITELFNKRKPLYAKYCHISVDITDFDIDEAVSHVLSFI